MKKHAAKLAVLISLLNMQHAFARFDMESGNFTCFRHETTPGGEKFDAVKLEKLSFDSFKLVWQGEVGTEPKEYTGTGYMGKTYGEVKFSSGKYAVREIGGSKDVISRLWVTGYQPLDLSCFTDEPQPTPIPNEGRKYE